MMRSQDTIAQEITKLRAKLKDLEAARGKNPDFSPDDMMKLGQIWQTEGSILTLMWVIRERQSIKSEAA